ncbi:ER degradation-enhancing alpha-mannosidase-like protein 3 [Dermatophagoides pteronyssinus]|uniref:alpha-1,2-Mannosidase n=1 Tax=Dermatophagoides pteronyssinus TaxID=6956 RepID=A0ABQ8JI60_DERPT|nr:ER degradation-enhancing alpha-mannosidase-like protein 3 [Dermatophagoides pteronyssinus]
MMNLLSLSSILLSLLFCSSVVVVDCMSERERIILRNEVREMFQHSYDSYMNYAYPADELMPLSCKGRFRGVELSRGDVDDALGNFSLTLIDTLDTLAIMGNYTEFEKAISLVINDVKFDSDIVVSVFETNIRILGGLLSAHVLAQDIQKRHHRDHLLGWYDNQLLSMAQDIGYRLLWAFNSTTGIPHPRVNLKYGMNSFKIGPLKETCTACAGSMILEFAALSRLTGDSIFEIKARKAMDYLWNQRHRQSDLVGNIINIDTGDWIRKESGVGAGIDSYYEYCLKTYILLGDEKYLDRFNRHYASIMKYISNGPFLIDVHMHRPHNQAKNFMDSLLAFWPGLQVLKGDLKPAIETHEILYQITRKHSFLPEAFTMDFNIHWPHHPLRPEFIESTYFLYQATRDQHYLDVGKDVLKNLQNFTRVHCEFNLDNYVFTTEAHLLPLSLAYTNNTYRKQFSGKFLRQNYLFTDSDYNCPTTKESLRKSNLYDNNMDNLSYFNILRMQVRDLISNRDSSSTSSKAKSFRQPPRIRAAQFSASKTDHIDLVKQLGINVIILKDGRVKLIHDSQSAQSMEAAEEGAYFMQEMITLSQQQHQYEQKLRTVSFILSKSIKVSLLAGPAQFGLDFDDSNQQKQHHSIESTVIKLKPFDGCNLNDFVDQDRIKNQIVLVERGNCMFIEKARNVQKFGAIGMIVIDNVENSSSKNLPMFSMSGDGQNDVNIHCVFLYSEDAKILMNAMEENPQMKVKLDVHHHDEEIVSVQKESNEDSSEQQQNSNDNNNYMQDLLANLFKTDKIKLNLLSMIDLKNLNGKHSTNMFMSMLKQTIASLPNVLTTENVNELDDEINDEKKLENNMNKCWNHHQQKPKHFIEFMKWSLYTCF